MVQKLSRSSFNCFLKACSSCLAASLWLRNLATRLTWPSTIMAGALGGIVCKGCVASRFELLGFARTICFVSVVYKAKEQTLRTTVHYVGVVLTCSWHARVALHCNVFTCKARSATASPQPFPPDPPFFSRRQSAHRHLSSMPAVVLGPPAVAHMLQACCALFRASPREQNNGCKL
jgi:hypothetical protein